MHSIPHVILTLTDRKCLSVVKEDERTDVFGAPCIFPFKYAGESHEKCLSVLGQKSICSTRTDLNGTSLEVGDCGPDCRNIPSEVYTN